MLAGLCVFLLHFHCFLLTILFCFYSLHPALFYLYFLLSIAFLFHSITFCLMMIKLLLHFLLHFGSNSFKNKRHGPIRNPFDKMAPDFKTSWRDLYDEICSIGPNIERIMSPGGYVSCLNRTKNAIERVQTLPTRSHKKSSSKAILFGSDLGGQKGVISLSSA